MAIQPNGVALVGILARCTAAVALAASALAFGIFARPAHAISSDYCGYGIVAAQPCWESGNYHGWRYNQASRGGGSNLPYICAYLRTAAGNYRTGSGCAANSNFYAFQVCDADPSTRAFVEWFGGDGYPTLYGHSDSRLCGAAAPAGAGDLPAYIADRLADPASGGQAGVSSNSARLVGRFAGGVDVFSASTTDRSCVLRSSTEGFSMGCSAKTSNGQQVVTEALDSGGYRVYGLAGDADTVTVGSADGNRVVAQQAASGAFAATLTQRPETATFANGRSSVAMAVHAP